MSDLARRRIRIDWEELTEAFVDSSADHRYYLDRETGSVHFFSSYLASEEEEEDEKAMAAEDRYVLISPERRVVPSEEIREFLTSLAEEDARRSLETSLRTREGYRRFEEALADHPLALEKWQRFVSERVGPRIKSWLADVGVDPLD
jgi:hypothetical protein